MSVAFRRESDEEHKEPRFDQPIPPGANLVTARGFAQIGASVEALERDVAQTGDGEARASLQRDLRYWRQRLATAQLAPAPPAERVGFGSQVRIRLNGAAKTIVIVGSDEADPATGVIPFTAPLAQALMGGETGDLVDFQGRPHAVEILSIGGSV